jgi:hypothetical protein
MKDYNHKGKSLKEGTGVDGLAVSIKAKLMLQKHGDICSEYIQDMENSFDKRELAVMASMFIHGATKEEDSPKEQPEIKVMSLNDKDLPPEVREAIKSMIDKMDHENPDSFDPECGCPRCRKNRAKATGSSETFTMDSHQSQGDC